MHGTGTRAVDVDKWKNGKEVQPHSQGQVMLVGVFLGQRPTVIIQQNDTICHVKLYSLHLSQ